ncbi:hypothetical protein ZIOFF_021954 [Zingiber officinale]|uniref:Uncharacterized protein n=1 Tax=Zingiber officinale TaxID=94328 RepID=A0A8J5LMD8_ZINOF|nr:hypothetical protein ZIOFF_021954 [Zingiber officinale]
MDTIQDDSDYDFLHQIQYMASLTQRMMFEEDFINPFASEGGGNESIAIGYEMGYPSLQRLIETPQEQIYSSNTVISPYNPPQEATMGPPGYPPASTLQSIPSSSQPIHNKDLHMLEVVQFYMTLTDH